MGLKEIGQNPDSESKNSFIKIGSKVLFLENTLNINNSCPMKRIQVNWTSGNRVMAVQRGWVGLGVFGAKGFGSGLDNKTFQKF